MADKAPRMNTTNLPRHETRCNGGSVSLVSRYAVIKNVRHNKRKRITVSAFDQRSQIPVIVQKRIDWGTEMTNLDEARRIARELRILKYLRGFDGICALVDIIQPSDDAWTDLYTIHEYGGVPMTRYINSKHPPTPRHARYWCYQLLRTLKFMHAGGVVHGHICPEKILVNAMSADIKLSDLGRCVVEGCSVSGSYNMSYMCPEELVVTQQPSAKGDVWAAGCVYAELLEKKGPLFQGSTHKEVLAKICARVGRPSETLLRDMIYGDTPMHQFVLAQDPVPGLPTGDSTSPYFRAAFSIADADADALQCIAATVRFDPRARMTAENALASLKLFQARRPDSDPCLHNPRDEPRLACSAYHESMASRDAPDAAGVKVCVWTECVHHNPSATGGAPPPPPPRAPPPLPPLPPPVQAPAPVPPVPGSRQVKQVVLVDTRGGPVPCMVVPGGVRPIQVPPNTLHQMVAIRERKRLETRARGEAPPVMPPPTILVPPGQAAPPGTVMMTGPPAAPPPPAQRLPAAFAP